MKASLSAAILLSLATLLPGQIASDIQYRDFTAPGGKIIQAVVVDKNDTQVILNLRDGKRVNVPIANLSPEDREYIGSWNKEKAVFLQKCRGLTIRQLLELRGYESFDFRFESNSIYMDGKLNGTPAKFLIDSGAGTSLIHLPFAETAKCEVGPMDEKIYGVAGEAPAGWTDVPTLSFGESVFKGRKILAADLANGLPEGAKVGKDAILGADIMSQLDAVISYPERKIFLRPDRSDIVSGETDDKPEGGGEPDSFRIFKTKDNKVHRGKVTAKTPSTVTITLVGGKNTQVPISSLIEADAAYVADWSEAGAFFLDYCQHLTVQELLELRKYQSFEYERRGNHIFVEGSLNKHDVTFMVDTGADGTCLNVADAKKYECVVGEMDQWVFGIGGRAPAAITTIPRLSIGNAVLTNRKILSTDLSRGNPRDMGYVGLFGADFLRELDAVITYRESRVFLLQRDAPPVAPVDGKK